MSEEEWEEYEQDDPSFPAQRLPEGPGNEEGRGYASLRTAAHHRQYHHYHQRYNYWQYH